MELIVLKNNCGMKVSISTVGAGLMDIEVPNKFGVIESVLAYPNDLKEYSFSNGYYGKPCGRTAGRIAKGEFILNGKKYIIDRGTDPNALHGGVKGFSFNDFTYELFENEMCNGVKLYTKSFDGEGGFPGNLDVCITYKLDKKSNQLTILFDAKTDAYTLCNLTNHAYFNLSGDCKDDVLNHDLQIKASKFGFVDGKAIPSTLIEVPKEFDFRTPMKIGLHVNDELVLRNTNGYDHPFMFDDVDYNKANVVLSEEKSGRRLSIYTTYQSVVAYSCNYPGDDTLKNGNKLKKYDGMCLECQHFPNSVNSDFLTEKKDILSPSKPYHEEIKFSFDIL